MTKQINVRPHCKNKNFENIVEKSLKSGIHIVASKGHGKTRLMFSIARKLIQKNCRVLIFDGSESWLYGFDKIATFNITEKDIALTNEPKTIEEIERYRLTNPQLIIYALSKYRNILFRLKTRKPSQRGFVIRQIINYLDEEQREQKATTENNEPKGYICYFIEEAQDVFNSRSTTRLEAEEFLTVFNEARNQKEIFVTASQRLTDFSKTIRTKQNYIIGRINEEDLTCGLKRLEKKYNVDFTKLEPRQWFYDDGIFQSPKWKQNGKPQIINLIIKKELKRIEAKAKKKKSLWSRIVEAIVKPEEIKKYEKRVNNEDEQFYEEEEDEDQLTEEIEDSYGELM